MSFDPRDYDKNTEFLKNIANPEAFVLRSKARAAAGRDEYKQTGCPHPFAAIEQYIDFDPGVKRNEMPCNLFECSLCHTLLWLVDPYGNEVPDG